VVASELGGRDSIEARTRMLAERVNDLDVASDGRSSVVATHDSSRRHCSSLVTDTSCDHARYPAQFCVVRHCRCPRGESIVRAGRGIRICRRMALSAGTRLGPYGVLPTSAPVEWGKCIGPATRRCTAMSRSRSCFPRSPTIPIAPRALQSRSPGACVAQPSEHRAHPWSLRDRRRARVCDGTRRRATLADRVVRGPIPINEALPIAEQIAEALEAAHELQLVAEARGMPMARSCLQRRLTVRSCVCRPPGASQLRSPNAIRRARLAISRPSSCPMAATFCSWQLVARQSQGSWEPSTFRFRHDCDCRLYFRSPSSQFTTMVMGD
jgi:hypothetical protein